MPPTNTTFATAITISVFPCDITQSDINDAGVNYTVYYRFTAPATARVIGAWGFSGNLGAGYRPTVRAYLGPAGAPTQILGIAAQNKPIQFPVTGNLEYFLEFTKNLDNAGPNSIRIQCEVASLGNPSTGDLLVNDDTNGFPMWIGTPITNNETRNFINPMSSGEAGDIIPAGFMLLEDISDQSVRLYGTTDFVQTFTTGVLVGNVRIRSNADRNLFYLGRYNAGSAFYRTINSNGVMTGEVALTTLATIGALCADVGNLILYVAPNGIGAAIKKWNIPGAAFLADLVAGVANYQIPDILVLSDGTIVALYHNIATQDVFVRVYNAAGATLNTWNFGIQTGTTKPRMAWALDNPNSVWVWTHTATASLFTNLKVSNGVSISVKSQQEYEGGAYNAAETATPVSRFGNSFSCPLMVLSVSAPPALFVIVTNKRNDNDGTQVVAIPAPAFKTALLP